MTRTRTPNGENGSQTSLIRILLSIVDLISDHHGHVRQELGEIKASQQTALTILTARQNGNSRSRATTIIAAIFGQLGVISGTIVMVWHWLAPLVRGWLGY